MSCGDDSGPVTLVRTVQTAMACPSQWDAWDDEGNYYYLRYRGGHGSITRYEDENWCGSPIQQEHTVIADFEFGHPLDGVISLEKFAELAGIALAPGIIRTGFGDHLRDELVTRAGIDIGAAERITQPWRDLGE